MTQVSLQLWGACRSQASQNHKACWRSLGDGGLSHSRTPCRDTTASPDDAGPGSHGDADDAKPVVVVVVVGGRQRAGIRKHVVTHGGLRWNQMDPSGSFLDHFRGVLKSLC